MIQAKIYLEIVTPEKVIFHDHVISVDVPSEQGRFTILTDHAPIVASLKEGIVKVVGRFSEDFEFACKSGFVECHQNEVTVLLEQ
jgi:F-type H+-transporting ATPase subunit epsilon